MEKNIISTQFLLITLQEKGGEVINVKNEKIIKMIKNNGYLYFGLSDEKLEKKNYYQHRFVY